MHDDLAKTGGKIIDDLQKAIVASTRRIESLRKQRESGVKQAASKKSSTNLLMRKKTEVQLQRAPTLLHK